MEKKVLDARIRELKEQSAEKEDLNELEATIKKLNGSTNDGLAMVS